MSDNSSPSNLSLSAQLEALLFAAAGSVTASQLAAVLDIPLRDIEKGLVDLENGYAERGIRLQRHQGQLQLTTAPEAASHVERLLGLETSSRLSRAALETLAIIAYQQPVTRPQVDAIRGVNSDAVIKNLLRGGLIQETGRAEGPGHPILYATTATFLQHFGFNSLDELPLLEDVEEQ